ncbi:polysaccharide biosynthesis/export family protein [Neisseria zoodegmatis]|uniref:Capsule polysaccharide export outer membrane protein n=1 Tax=Neisseria zoodegmatis TaxID=326523 RepID=A0AB38DUB7_9NEIS|nr:polysaccharide biosynthesis/export family protein [Neisseria zoodegmatis]OSI10203.1 sugar ABC transporter substrate-binding protein [Neisseria zoodegmatis]SNU80799.1 capsule polysaccharide export outer membrane protein [Neisseria zoodegmatis]
MVIYKAVGVIFISVALNGCGNLPTSGPNQIEVINLKNHQVQVTVPDVAVVDIDESVLSSFYSLAQQQSFLDFGVGNARFADAVGAGDVLEITLWEAAPAVLFGGALNSVGSGSAQTVSLPPQIVDTQGMVSVPFLGNVPVSGKTPVRIQKEIVGRLKKMANQPQAMVRVVQNNSSNATVIRAGRSIRMPLTGHRERVLDAVAAIGGTDSGVQDISVQMTRGNMVRTVALETITAQPAQNVVLQPGDVITLLSKPLSFTALGALGKNQQISFSAKGMNLGEAIGASGGLLDRRANPKGIFVFRYQPLELLPQEEKEKWLAKGYDISMEVPTVYRMNLLDANSLFWLQKFPMKDKDIVYVANAPLAEMQKFLQFVFSPVVSGVNSINNIAN